MDLFDYMRETNTGKGIAAGIQNASADVGRGSGTAAYYRERQTFVPCDQGG